MLYVYLQVHQLQGFGSYRAEREEGVITNDRLHQAVADGLVKYDRDG